MLHDISVKEFLTKSQFKIMITFHMDILCKQNSIASDSNASMHNARCTLNALAFASRKRNKHDPYLGFDFAGIRFKRLDRKIMSGQAKSVII